MKVFINLIFFSLFLCSLHAQNTITQHPIDIELETCLNKAENQTTLGMMTCEGKAEEAWDKELNKNYKLLLGVLKASEKEQLRTAQRMWLRYRDLEKEFSGNMHYNMEGTMYRVMAAGRETLIIRQRALELKQYYETKMLH